MTDENAEVKTGNDQPSASSIRDVVAATYDRIEAADTDKPTETPTDKARSAPENFDKPKPVAAKPAAKPGEVATPAVPAADEVLFPEHWDKAQKAEFDALPATSRKFLIEREKAMTADYTRKRQADADFMRDFAPLKEILKPFEGAMRQNNMPPAQLIRNWAVAENMLNTDPVNAIRKLADYYGVDLATAADYTQIPQKRQNAPDPQYQQLSGKVSEIDSYLQTQRVQASEANLNTFADAKSETGEPVHPYFDTVIPQMMQLLTLEKSQGKTDHDLKELYDQACWMNTSVRAQMIAGTQPKPNQADPVLIANAANARQKAQQAKNAAASVNGDPGTTVKPIIKKPTSIRGAIEQAYEQQG